jgi:hypothetical protein
MHPDNTVICQVKIFVAMKAAQAAKLCTCKGKKKYFSQISKPVSTPVLFSFLFFDYLFSKLKQNLFLRAKPSLTNIFLLFITSFIAKKAIKDFIAIGAI